MEICKTGAKKSSPGLLNFFLFLAGHDVITDANKATTCMRKFKAPII